MGRIKVGQLLSIVSLQIFQKYIVRNLITGLVLLVIG